MSFTATWMFSALNACFRAGLLWNGPDSSALGPGGGAESLSIGWLLFKTVGALLLIIALIFGVVFLLKRTYGRDNSISSGQQWFQILARIAVQPRQSVALVKVMDRLILVGITESTITTLAEFGNSTDVQKLIAEMQLRPPRPGEGKFISMLKKQMEGKG